MTTSAPAAPNAPAEAGVDGGLGFLARRGDDDALAGGETVRLDDDGKGLRGEIRLGARGVLEAAISGGGD